ncbi:MULTISPECIES: M24 family metallopeptidase [Pseudoalteromonas]|uniref:M24 family metallopeptidase n=1 Tax=Pseudoalteromonas TaxID=53246 RepID=UPI0015FA407C|nr:MULTISPECIES: Xaa-Pro peptidase family protein [unclassified Pseudoalteromonas]MBB1304894.1 aminopeptidase P family protein [Pseudoalteromonas sp. SR43-5]MBB1326370.1 aminopeptidase P family protein [Pseudoalteromonas sp. SR45-1]MBB1349259.1 aminopeptidase P family protein [Pseudoalteromonas sp. SG45-3]MBB1357295.1 aminopeptidase P family protein [Pseudoalteromonas sp. SG45-6]|tara:strand:+ start:22742 stop:23962 length:1221 start_codon:yes stop_codon:yes gene_type:complete
MTTIGIGTQSSEQALASLSNMTQTLTPIAADEHLERIAKAQAYMLANNIDAIYLNAGTNLTYFTGMKWYASERMVGAILPALGEVQYIAPYFEIGSLNGFKVIDGPIHGWQEHENPYALFVEVLKKLNINENATIGIDESAQFFIFDGINKAQTGLTLINAQPVTAHCRMHKSVHELSLMQRAMDMTLAVHQATASMLYEGITTTEVEAFIKKAHQKVGAPGNYFCIVLFGVATSFPHGVKDAQILKKGDMVLIDTGCKVHDYLSDITRTYVFGEPTMRQRMFWDHEKAAQMAAFNAAKIGATCEDVDAGARNYLAAQGLGPQYQTPGCPHRTGHGIGLDIHEWPYLVGGDKTPLAPGMCFSNEPMLVIPDEFGVRLEDHFYMTDNGPHWFTQPSYSIDDPFGLNA